MVIKKHTYRLTLATLLAGVLLLTLNGCDVFGGDDDERIDQPYFRYEVYDESGDLIQTVTNEHTDEVEIETGLGLFGEQFIPPFVVEYLAESSGIDPDDLNLNRNEIYLHAETGIDENIHFATLNFKFSSLDDWFEGRFQVFGISKEHWLEVLRIIWGFHLDQLQAVHAGAGNHVEPFRLNVVEAGLQPVVVNYNEFGFGLDGIQHLYIAIDGMMEIVNVSDDILEGNFSIELAGLPVDVLHADEFPAAPEFRNIRIVGDFIAEYGDYNDLMKARADLILGGAHGGVTFTPGR